MVCNEITETIRINMGQDPLNLPAFRRIDASLLSFYEQNLAQPEVEGEEGVNASDRRPNSQESVKT